MMASGRQSKVKNVAKKGRGKTSVVRQAARAKLIATLSRRLERGRCAMNDERRGAVGEFGLGVTKRLWCAKKPFCLSGQQRELQRLFSLDAGDRTAAANRTRPEGKMEKTEPISTRGYGRTRTEQGCPEPAEQSPRRMGPAWGQGRCCLRRRLALCWT